MALLGLLQWDGKLKKKKNWYCSLFDTCRRNTWNYFACDDQCVNGDYECISEDLVKATADAMVASGMAAVGFEYINLVKRARGGYCRLFTGILLYKF